MKKKKQEHLLVNVTGQRLFIDTELTSDENMDFVCKSYEIRYKWPRDANVTIT